MKIAELIRAGTLQLVEGPAEEPGPGQVQVAAVGICGFGAGSIGGAESAYPQVLWRHHIKKLKGVAPSEGQYRLSVGRWRFRYDIVGRLFGCTTRHFHTLGFRAKAHYRCGG
jgi:hypothetical protein